MTEGEPLRVESRTEGRTVHLGLVGELTHATVPLFDEHVLGGAAGGHPHLALDVGRLQFCDSVGLSALIGAHRRAALAGGRVTLRGVHGSLQRMLHLTGVGELFTILSAHDCTDALDTADGPGRTG